jgi:hypothetical protein
MEKLLLATLLILCCAGVQGKEGRTYYDEAMMGRVRQKLEKYEWARQQADSLKSSCEWLLKMADQELWDFVPPHCPRLPSLRRRDHPEGRALSLDYEPRSALQGEVPGVPERVPL